MVFDPASAPHLKPWLVRTLEPICDAEPGALADYILALLRHNVPESEMRTELAVQLDEFLEKECSSFIETLFTVLRTKSYLPYGTVPASPSFPEKPLDTGIPIPLDGLLTPTTPQERTRKRSNTNDERDGRPPAKGPRLSTEGQFSRYGNGGADGRMGQPSTGGWGRPQGDRFRDSGVGAYNNGQMGVVMGMNGMGQMNGRRPQSYQPPDQKRGICRDYHNNGYCARGALCKYSHGDDAVIPSQLYPMNGGSSGPGMSFMQMFSGNANGMPFMQGAAYDPHEARMDMRPMTGRNHQRAPLLPRIQQEDGRVIHPINASGELPVIQDLTPTIYPDVPDVSAADPAPQSDDVDMQQANNQALPNQMANKFKPMLGPMNENGYPLAVPSMDVDMAGSSGMRPPIVNHGQYRGGIRGGHGSRGRGTFGGEVHNFRPEKRNDKTLVVEKIPEDKLSLEQVNAWFKRFGTVTNVAIDAVNAKALVSFSNHDEAHAAWKSEDAVFNNRFVKVFWHRPMEGHGQVGTRMLAASAPLVANMAAAAQASPTSQPSASTVPSVPPTASTSTSTSTITSITTSTLRKTGVAPPPLALSALAAKQHRLEEAINEQKALMASLETASADQKKDIMAKLRKLGEEMTNLTAAASSTPEMAVGASGGTTVPNSGKRSGFDKMTEHERRERERLDKELDMDHHQQYEDETEDLKAKLERLKAEAASLGLDAPLPSSSGGYRGYRGRGRAASRSYFRGGPVMRGGPPRGSMKLDNRPKKLLVKGVHEDSSQAQALRDWYETTGQLESIESAGAGAYLISFKSRMAAEQGLAKGTNIPIVGAVQISWHTGGKISTNGGTTSTPVHTAVTKLLPTTTKLTSGGITGVVESSSSSRSKVGSERPETPDIHSHIQEEEIIASGWGVDGDDEDGMGML